MNGKPLSELDLGLSHLKQAFKIRLFPESKITTFKVVNLEKTEKNKIEYKYECCIVSSIFTNSSRGRLRTEEVALGMWSGLN